jgi:CRP/FNR family transcriptional regulator, cyclic AMP receptor protein
VTVVAAVGYLASALVFATFWMKAAVPLRQVAIASNVVFFSYGVMDRV